MTSVAALTIKYWYTIDVRIRGSNGCGPVVCRHKITPQLRVAAILNRALRAACQRDDNNTPLFDIHIRSGASVNKNGSSPFGGGGKQTRISPLATFIPLTRTPSDDALDEFLATSYCELDYDDDEDESL